MSEKILVIDDDEEFADLLGLLLSRKGFEAETVFGGVQALQKVQEISPSIILQDYMLPDFRGIELLKELKEKCPQAYVIIVTARGSEEVAVELMKAGAADYLKKPFEAEKLLTTIENVLRLKASEAERHRLSQEIMQQNLQLMAFNAFSNALTSGMPAEDKCRSALGIVVKNMRVDLAAVFVRDNGRSMKLMAAHTIEEGGLPGRVLDKDTGLASYVAEIKKPAVVSDFGKEKRFTVPMEARECGLTSALAVPMMVKDSLKGVLVVYSREHRAFPSFDMKLMGSFANQIAMSLENADLSGKMAGLQRRWQTTFDAVQDRITLQDPNHTILMANKAAAEMAGLESRELAGQQCCWAFHGSKSPIHDCPVTESVKTKKVVYRELSPGKPAGTFAVWAHPVFDEEGNVESVVEYVRKISG